MRACSRLSLKINDYTNAYRVQRTDEQTMTDGGGFWLGLKPNRRRLVLN